MIKFAGLKFVLLVWLASLGYASAIAGNDDGIYDALMRTVSTSFLPASLSGDNFSSTFTPIIGACRSCVASLLDDDTVQARIEIRSNTQKVVANCYVIATVTSVADKSFDVKYFEYQTVATEIESDVEVQPNLGAPFAVATYEKDIVQLAMTVVDEFNVDSNSPYRFALYTIAETLGQVISGFQYKIQIVIRSTTCLKSSATCLTYQSDLASENSDSIAFSKCDATFRGFTWPLTLNDWNCEPVGVTAVLQSGILSRFDSPSGQFSIKLEPSTVVVQDTSGNLVNSLWSAAFAIGGSPKTRATQYQAFLQQFNRDYNAAESEVSYMRFTENAARVAMAQLIDANAGVFSLSSSKYADLHVTEFCTSLKQISSTSDAESQLGTSAVSSLQFYAKGSFQTMEVPANTALFSLLTGAANVEGTDYNKLCVGRVSSSRSTTECLVNSQVACTVNSVDITYEDAKSSETFAARSVQNAN